MNNGIVDAWTGVIRWKPMLEIASRIHSASGGVRASHAREEVETGALEEVLAASGAISLTPDWSVCIQKTLFSAFSIFCSS